MYQKLTMKRTLEFVLMFFVVVGSLLLLTTARASAATVYTHSYSGDKPFFNEYLENDYVLDDTGSIDRWFDTLGPVTNTSNFCSLGTASYANINGKTVTVDIFNRDPGDSIDDPNFGQGMLIYQCIQYKVQHPEADVSIYFSSYRTSATAAVCVNRNSRYFGYMRSLFDCDYDKFGFVRISFMLVEAARMGINVTAVTQLDSYGVNQYSATAAKGYASRSNISHEYYFSKSMTRKCYSAYEANKNVSDFFRFVNVGWDVNKRGGDMMHAKVCAVSNYRDMNGVDHSGTIFVTSSNLDEIDYLGRNGNTGSQSGAIISDHDQLYNVMRNYMETMVRFQGVDEIPYFREFVRSTQTKQIDMIRAGLGDTIPMEDRLVYLGSETDNVFEMCFTPLPGGVMVWDTNYNPYAKYISEMAASDGQIVFTWNMPYNACSNHFEYTFEDIICEAFHRNKNPQNRIYMHFESFKANKYNDLVVGRDIGFKAVNTNLNKYLHSKDVVMSYDHGGARKYISIVSSANFGIAAFWQRANTVLVIKETEASHDFYTTFGRASTYGGIQ